MYAKVKRLRNRGQRLTDQEIANAIPAEGVLVMSGQQWNLERVIALRNPNDHVSEPLIPILCDVRLMGLQNGKMMLWGVERPEGEKGPEYIQEWSVLVVPR
ncbi:hypothetical protein [Massilia aerilata]|uniref:Uncharacterized protein n=1 Tax=Massilia aerilata TaxID=453817 RepID=A0ABW0RVZ1_9BURK